MVAKKILNVFIKNIHYLYLIGVIALGMITIIGSGDGGGGTSEAPPSYIKGRVTEAHSGDPIQGARIKSNYGGSATSLPDGSYLMSHSAGTYTLAVCASGYVSVTRTGVVVPEGGTVTQDFELTPNTVPDKPILLSPTNGETDVSLTPELKTEDFNDPDLGDIHTESQWQISVDNSFSSEYVILDVKNEFVLTSLVPELILEANTEYYWRVKFYDNNLLASDWSDVYSFITIIDSDSDGMPDTWEVQYGLNPSLDDSSGDLDGDQISNLDEYRLRTDPTEQNPISGSIMGFIHGVVTDAYTDNPIEGAQIVTSGSCLAFSLPDGSYLMVHPAGTYTLAVSASGYYSITKAGIVILEGGDIEEGFELTRIYDGVGSDDPGGGCFIATAANGAPTVHLSPLPIVEISCIALKIGFIFTMVLIILIIACLMGSVSFRKKL